MYKTLIGCLLAQATFEILERWENFLPPGSGIHQFSSEITASAQLFTFGVIPAVTQFHEAQTIMSRDQCIAVADSTKALIGILDIFDEVQMLDGEINDFISQLNTPFWADKLNVKMSLFPAILVLLAWGTPLLISKTSDISREEIEKDFSYNAFISGTIVVACAFHLMHAYRNRVNLANQQTVMGFTQRAQSLMKRSGLGNPLTKLSLLLSKPDPNLDLVNRELSHIEEVTQQNIKSTLQSISNIYRGINVSLANMHSSLEAKSDDDYNQFYTLLSQKINRFKESIKISTDTEVSSLKQISTIATEASELVNNYINSIEDKKTRDSLIASVQDYREAIRDAVADLRLPYKKLSNYKSALQSCTPLNRIDDVPLNHICTMVIAGVNKVSVRDALSFSSNSPERSSSINMNDDDMDDDERPLLGHAN